jgi:hypothetical protein
MAYHWAIISDFKLIEHGSGIRGKSKSICSDPIHRKAYIYFWAFIMLLLIHASETEISWSPYTYHNDMNMLWLWNRSVKMSNERNN